MKPVKYYINNDTYAHISERIFKINLKYPQN